SLAMSKVAGKKLHWRSKVQETFIPLVGGSGELGIAIGGGADYGEFPFVTAAPGGGITVGDIIIEIGGTPVLGLTLGDVRGLLNSCPHPIRIKSVSPGSTLCKDLRLYLSKCFTPGSMDSQLQQVIRENLYLRAVPSPGILQFLHLDQSAHLPKYTKPWMCADDRVRHMRSTYFLYFYQTSCHQRDIRWAGSEKKNSGPLKNVTRTSPRHPVEFNQPDDDFESPEVFPVRSVGTTRQPRDGEITGVDYNFVTVEEFFSLEESGALLESGKFKGQPTFMNNLRRV
ncbi:Membrane-associated guanylate kinase, WW and PDZ domain-containing protein 3, partial [Anabarilius grahami]